MYQPNLKTTKIPTLASLKNKSQQPNIKDKESIQEKPLEVIENQGFTEKDLQEKWQEFSSQIPKNERFFLDRKIQLQENQKIQIEFDNQLMADKFQEKYEKNLLAFLKKELRNQKINIEIIIKKQEIKKQLYTASDKLEHLIEKYPALNDLKDRFDLNINS